MTKNKKTKQIIKTWNGFLLKHGFDHLKIDPKRNYSALYSIIFQMSSYFEAKGNQVIGVIKNNPVTLKDAFNELVYSPVMDLEYFTK